MRSGTKVTMFLNADELSILDLLAHGLLCSRQEAVRYLLAERKKRAAEFRAIKDITVKKRAENDPKRGPGRPRTAPPADAME